MAGRRRPGARALGCASPRGVFVLWCRARHAAHCRALGLTAAAVRGRSQRCRAGTRRAAYPSDQRPPLGQSGRADIAPPAAVRRGAAGHGGTVGLHPDQVQAAVGLSRHAVERPPAGPDQAQSLRRGKAAGRGRLKQTLAAGLWLMLRSAAPRRTPAPHWQRYRQRCGATTPAASRAPYPK